MKLWTLFASICLGLVVQAQAATIDAPAAPQEGALYPISLTGTASEENGNKILSVGADLWQSVVAAADGVKTELSDSWFKWSYNRGVGRLPSQCPAGYDSSLGSCVQTCPTGYSGVAGVCWQACPAGFSDTGAFCTNWSSLKTVSKASFIAARAEKSCVKGMQNEAGLCYEPCAETFTGVGPFCFGQMNKSQDETRMAQEVAAQHQAASAAAPAGGLVLAKGSAPKLRTHIIFTPIICASDAIDGAFGLLPDPMALGGMAVDAAGDAVVGEISKAINQGGASFIPTVANTVLFDFSADARCEDNGQVSKASLAMNPSVTVKVSTSLFDPVLHNLSGVDLGIMRVSIYELIPFRIYGTVGTTVSAPLALESQIDRSLPALVVENQQYATRSAFNATPGLDLWLSSDAQIRVTSLFSFIPDLVQLGAEFKLHVLDNKMPYRLEEGLRANNTGYELFRQERLDNELKSGHGYVQSYLRVLGIAVDAFGEKGRIAWQGHSQQDNLILKETVTPLAL